jgi:beta-lactamase regulating signal transducer with metallopeptidase domain
MSTERLFVEILIDRVGWWLIHFTWQTFLIAMITGFLLFILHKAGAKIKYMICCGALALIVVLPIATVMIAANQQNHPLITFRAGTNPPVETKDIYWDKVLIGTQYRRQAASIPALNAVIRHVEKNLPGLILVWLSGVFLFSAYRFTGFINLHFRIQSFLSPLESTWENSLQQLIRRLQIRQKIRLFQSTVVSVPSVIGWMKPILLIPISFFSGMNPRYIESIILHELAHIRRYDYLVNMIQVVVETLGFFHPMVWWLSHCIREEREHCCDDWAVQVLGDRLIYVKSLVHLEESRQLNALVLAANGSNLFQRIARILNQPVRRSYSASMLTFIFSIGTLSLFLFSGFARFSNAVENPADFAQDASRYLVAYYPFDGNAHDESGFDQHGIVKGAVLTSDRNGQADRAYDFNGSYSCIIVPKTNALNTAGSVTVSCWIFPRRCRNYESWISRANAKDCASQWRAGFGENRNSEWGLTECHKVETGKRWLDYWITRANIPLNDWTNVTTVADQDFHRVILYVNGEKIGQFADLKPFEESAAPLLIGFQKDDQVYFDGKIDDIRIYNRALDEKQVYAAYQLN